MKIINKDQYGWQIGKWNTPISVRWFRFKILRHYGVRFDDKYNTLCFGRLEIRIWKPLFMRSSHGIYFYREMQYDQDESV